MNKKAKSKINISTSFIAVTFLLLLSFSINSIVNGSQNGITVTYSFQKPTIEPIEIYGTTYDRIILPDCTPAGSPGEPMIPSKGAYILLPPNTKASEIYINAGKKIDIRTDFFVEPIGNPIPISKMNSFSVPIPDHQIYDNNAFYPGTFYSEVNTYIFRGYYILVLLLNPIQYNPVTGELSYYSELTISIETAPMKASTNMFRGLEKDKNEVLKKIDNPGLIEQYHKKIIKPFSGSTNHDLLILTTDGLKDGFEPLKEAHNATGINTTIKTLTDIGSNNLDDIRDYIRNAYKNWKIDYVLIGGDDDVIPDPWLWVYGLDENTTPYEANMPSDIFYACLDGPFNYDGDDKWGEPTDGENGSDVDLIADVYVGRACVGDESEVKNFVSKTIEYINKDPEEDYLTEVSLVGEYLGNYGIASWGGNYLDQLINGSDDDGYTTVGISANDYNITTLYDRDWPGHDWPKSEILNRIDKGIHIINHLGHSNYYYNMKMGLSDIQSQKNEKNCFIYSQGCMAGGFDNKDCIAEYFSVKTNYSAFAVIMNARYGWFWSYSTDGDSQRFHREFWDAVFGENTPEIGKANHDSKEDNLHIIGRSCIRWCYYQLNLFGDPCLTFYEPVTNDPPEIPKKPSEKIGEEFTYVTNTTDSDGDQIFYRWNWGDGTFSEWIGPYDSGATCEASHAWSEIGVYEIRVQASDTFGGTSNWSDPLMVQIDLPKIEIGNINSGLLRIKVNIKNNGTAEATNISWCIKLDCDFILFGNNTTGTILDIPIQGEESVRSGFIFGFGDARITAFVEDEEKISHAFIFGPFVFMVFVKLRISKASFSGVSPTPPQYFSPAVSM
jgi:hypothetical protein